MPKLSLLEAVSAVNRCHLDEHCPAQQLKDKMQELGYPEPYHFMETWGHMGDVARQLESKQPELVASMPKIKDGKLSGKKFVDAAVKWAEENASKFPDGIEVEAQRPFSKTPNYDKLPVEFRVYQERAYYEDLHRKEAEPLSANADEQTQEAYVASLRKENDARMASGHDLDTVRESLGTMSAQFKDGGAGLLQFMRTMQAKDDKKTKELPSTGRSAQDIIDRGHGKGNFGPSQKE